MAISITPKATTYGHFASAGRIAPCRHASGSRISAASRVRIPARAGGDTSTTAILMKRYGMPQITAIAAKSTQARLLMCAGAVLGAAVTGGAYGGRVTPHRRESAVGASSAGPLRRSSESLRRRRRTRRDR